MTARKSSNRNIKKQLEEIQDEFKLTALTRARKLMEMQNASDFWLTSYVDILDRYRDGGQVVYPVSNPNDRRAGSNFPFWMSESQLSIIRASSRLIVTMNPAAYGLINGITSYVIGSGFTYRAMGIEGMEADEKLIRAVQKAIDKFMEANSWKEMEQELFFRSREDGEAFLRLFPQQNGTMQVRTVEPEQVIQPPNSTFEEWSYGIQTDIDDVFDIKAYYVHYLSPGGVKMEDGTTGEVVDSDQMIHIKSNVKKSIKRGLPDLSFDTLETFSLASKLRRNMGEGAAVQAAIAAVRQHDTASASQVETFVQNAIDYSLNIPFNGRQQDYTKIDAGSFLDIPKGMNYIPPPGAANANAHLSIHSALLRAAGTRHNAPEWLVSGDASNNNYASSLTAESPFLRNCQRLQSSISRPFKRIVIAAVKNAIEAGRLPSDTLKKIEIVVTPPTVETRNRTEEANSNKTYVELGVKSRQRVAQEIGLDWKKEAAEIEDYNEKFGPKGQGPGPEGPGGPGGPGEPPQPPAPPQPGAKRPQLPTEGPPAGEPKGEKPQVTESLTEGKYDHIRFTPPEGARKAAQRALDVRAEKPESERGMTPVGIARARDLINGKELSPDTVRRMKAFFDRHQSDKSGSTWDEKGKGWQAWMGWGGDAGYAWARKVVRQMDAADEVTEAITDDGWVTRIEFPDVTELVEAKKGEEGHWVTLHGDSMHGGVHVFLKPSGEISKGPKALIGKKPSELKKDKVANDKAGSVVQTGDKSSTPMSGISFSSGPIEPQAKPKKKEPKISPPPEKKEEPAAKVEPPVEQPKPKEEPKAEVKPSEAPKVEQPKPEVKPEEPKIEIPKTINYDEDEPTPFKNEIPHPSELTTKSSLGGSTGALLKTDKEGNKFVEKGGASPDHVKSEYLADKIYHAMGVPVADTALYDTPNGPKKVSKFVDGTSLGSLQGKAKEDAINDLKKNFVMDALLANWDVVGLNQDNVLVDKSGKAYRIDNGGSLKFRAMGKGKDFGPVATEIDTLRTSPQGKSIFGSLTDNEIASQVRKISQSKNAILDAAKTHGASPDIVENLGKRIDNLKERFLQKPSQQPEKTDSQKPAAGVENFETSFAALAARNKEVLAKMKEYQKQGHSEEDAYKKASKEVPHENYTVKHDALTSPKKFDSEYDAADAYTKDFNRKAQEHLHMQNVEIEKKADLNPTEPYSKEPDYMAAREYAGSNVNPDHYQFEAGKFVKDNYSKDLFSELHADKELNKVHAAIKNLRMAKNPNWDYGKDDDELQSNLKKHIAFSWSKNPSEIFAPANHDEWQFKSGEIRRQILNVNGNFDAANIKKGSDIVKKDDDPDAHESTSDYSGSYHRQINPKLWSGGELEDYHQKKFDDITRAIAKGGALEKPITVWRGIRSDPNKTFDISKYEKMIGQHVALDGFQSASVDPVIAAEWAQKDSPVIEFKTKRGIYMDGGISKHPNEEEWLMGHGWKYRVVGVQRGVKFSSAGPDKTISRDVIQLELL